jgi:hypothetical protein
MLVLGDARERRARLALAAGAEREHFVGRQVAVDINRAEFLDAVEVAGLARDLRMQSSRGRPRPLRARTGQRLRDGTQPRHIGGEGRTARAGAVRMRSGIWQRRIRTASGLRARRWLNPR